MGQRLVDLGGSERVLVQQLLQAFDRQLRVQPMQLGNQRRGGGR